MRLYSGQYFPGFPFLRKALPILGLLMSAACSFSFPQVKPPDNGDGVYHTVEQGQTLWRIARTYDADLGQLVEVNRLATDKEIFVGQRLFIPGARQALPQVSPASGALGSEEGREGGLPEEKPKKPQHWEFIWPVSGPLYSPFGKRGRRFHGGIDISAPKGTPVRAVAPGEVIAIRKGWKGLGHTLFLRHLTDLVTVYAHNSAILVKRGQHVEQGQAIAKVGRTGNSSGPHLHFEVRYRGRPLNPLFFLQGQGPADRGSF